MRILTCDKLEDCIDGSSTFEYLFNVPWTPEAITRLDGLGHLEYFSHLPRPYFRITTPDGLRISGVVGDDLCQATFPARDKALCRQEFERRFA